MKRIMSFGIVITLIILLAACGDLTGKPGNRGMEPENADFAASGSIDPGKLKPVNMIMIFMGAKPKDLPMVQAEMDRYTKEKLNATVEIRPIDWGAYRDKTNLMFASNEQFDLLFTSPWMYLGDEVAKKQIIELDSLIDKYGQGIKAILDPAVVEGGKIGGKTYAVATNKEFAADKGIIMRKDLVEKHNIGISRIKDLKDLTPVFETIKKTEPGITPLQVKGNESPMSVVLGYGKFDMLGDGPGVLDRAARDFKVINLLETPIYMEYAKLQHEWYKAGYINRDGASSTEMTYTAVREGKAFSYGQSGKPGIDAQEARNAGRELVYVPLTKPYMTTGDTTSAMFAIPTTAVDPARAMMYLNMLFTDKYLLNLLNWGVEGIHYKKVSGNIIDYPDGVTAANTGYTLNMSWMFGNQMNNYLWTTEDPQLWDKLGKFNREAERSIALGFIFVPDKVKNEVAAINNVNTLFQGAVNSGAIDPEIVVPQYIQRLKEAGLDEIIAEKQAQLDAWRKANGK